jgi:hypothetical protein
VVLGVGRRLDGDELELDPGVLLLEGRLDALEELVVGIERPELQIGDLDRLGALLSALTIATAGGDCQGKDQRGRDEQTSPAHDALPDEGSSRRPAGIRAAWNTDLP